MITKSTYLSQEECIEVLCSGPYSLSPIKKVIQEVSFEAREKGIYRILFNGLYVEEPKSEADRYMVGLELATYFRPPIKVAILYPQQFITKFAENTAVNRGAKVLVTSDRNEALNWLSGN